MAKLTPQVKGIIRFAKTVSPEHHISGKTARALKKQLRKPGVSKRQKALETRLIRKDLLILGSPALPQNNGEIRGVKQAFHEQDKISRQAKRHPHQGGNPAKSFDAGSVGNHMKYKP